MLRNYLIIALRNLRKNNLYSLLNAVGLLTASALCILSYAFIQHELSFDRFHQKANRLYRVEFMGIGDVVETGTRSFLSNLTTPDNNRYVKMPPGLGPELVASFPEVVAAFRFLEGRREIIQVGDKKFVQENICVVDSNLFTQLSFRLLKGNPRTALAEPTHVVLSEQTATRYFGETNPIGRTITLIRDDSPTIFTVTGVIENTPATSSIAYEVLFPFHAQAFVPAADASNTNRMFNLSALTLIELDEKSDVPQFRTKLRKFAQAYYHDYVARKKIPADQFGLIITPLTGTHLDSIAWGWPRMGKKLNLYVLGVITVLILGIASLNYIFMTLTSASARLQEVGVRKVNGASRMQVIVQFWTETLVLVTISVGAGFLVAGMALPLFNQLLATQLDTAVLMAPSVWVSAVALVMLISVLTGIYPALLVSRFNPVWLLQRNRTYRVNPALSRRMVVVQYTLCLFLVITVVVMQAQFRYITNKNLGFNKEHIVVIDLMKNFSLTNPSVLLEKLKRLPATHPDIVAVSGGDALAGTSMMSFAKIRDQDITINFLSGDYQYVSMLGLQILEGRSISPDFPTDTSGKGAVVINETLAAKLGSDCPVGYPCPWLDSTTVVGIVKDFYYESLSRPIGPALLQYHPAYIPAILIKIRPDNIPASLATIEQAWQRFNADVPLTYSFMDQDIARMYDEQQRWVQTIEIGTVLAILVACLGLVGLSGLHAVNRTKEIGIRKVLGASARQIFMLLNYDTIRLGLLSFLIAVPLAYYVANQWLQDFTYRISLGWELFAVAGSIGLAIALIAVSYHSIKAALANPVESLRNE